MPDQYRSRLLLRESVTVRLTLIRALLNPSSSGLVPSLTFVTIRTDLDSLIDYCKCHKCSPDGYYKKKVHRGKGGGSAELKCRFSYPIWSSRNSRTAGYKLKWLPSATVAT